MFIRRSAVPSSCERMKERKAMLWFSGAKKGTDNRALTSRQTRYSADEKKAPKSIVNVPTLRKSVINFGSLPSSNEVHI